MESRLAPNISQMVTHQPFLCKGYYLYELLDFKQKNNKLGTNGINILQSIWKTLLIMLFKSFVFVPLLCPWPTQVEHYIACFYQHQKMDQVLMLILGVDFLNCFVPYADLSRPMPNCYVTKKLLVSSNRKQFGVGH